ncbi:MAG: hypothetical protein C4583_03270 [Anaerolineaceae bacterium]|nr:MAG: hypothetical protein C4583_03270 [Anaerolineaceae bacterium]
MTSRDTIGREPITIVEIDQDYCLLTYGVAPCAAALGVTGAAKCYHGIATCQDTANFDLGTLTLRFASPMESHGLGDDVTIIPSLIGVDTVPTVINVGGADRDTSPLGKRAKITVTLRDHPYHDRLVDPYWSERDYVAMALGTFWSKWLARNPYHQGRALRVRQGYVGQSLSEMTVRHYIIDRIEGPTKGIVSIVAQDPLKLLDGSRAQTPTLNTGTLDGAIDDNDMSFTLVPSGIGNSQYDASGIGRLGSELISYTRSGDTVTITARALRGTQAASHAAGDVFQEVLVISSQRVDLLLADLLQGAGIASALIPSTDWDEEADLWLNGFNLSAWIAEPTSIAQLVEEILQQACCFIWWDEEDQEIKFRAVRPFYAVTDDIPIDVTDDGNLVADSVVIEARPDERISEVIIRYAQINPLGAIDDAANYARRRRIIDSDAEDALQYNERRTKEIFARFLDDANDAATSVLATRILERHADTPKVISFATDAKDALIKAGTVVRMTHHGLVDVTGAALPTLLQIMSRDEIDAGHRIAFEARPYLSRTRYGFIMANGSPVYGSATAEQKEDGGWIAPNAVGFSNGDLPYRIL